MSKQILRNNNAATALFSSNSFFFPWHVVLAPRSPNLQDWGAENKTCKKTNKPNLQFYSQSISQAYWFPALAFSFAQFLLPSFSRPLFLCYQQSLIFFFHDWKPFLVSFYTEEWAHSHKHANNWNTVWRGYWGDEKSFPEGEGGMFLKPQIMEWKLLREYRAGANMFFVVFGIFTSRPSGLQEHSVCRKLQVSVERLVTYPRPCYCRCHQMWPYAQKQNIILSFYSL